MDNCLHPILSLSLVSSLYFVTMEAFFNNLKAQIDAKTQFNVNDNGCNLWIGARTSNGLYGRKQVTFPDGNRKLMRISRVVQMVKGHMLYVPAVNDEGHIIEMSHLCHNSLCVNPDHLILELRNTNAERKLCKNQGFCTENHNPLCIM